MIKSLVSIIRGDNEDISTVHLFAWHIIGAMLASAVALAVGHTFI